MDSTHKGDVRYSRREWRKTAKKLRRKRIRKASAMSAQQLIEDENLRKLKDPTYLTWLVEQRALDLIHEEAAKQLLCETQQKWQQYDKEVMKKWQQKLDATARLEAAKDEEKQRIKREFDAEQKNREKLRNQQKRMAEEKQRHYEALVKRIDDYIHGVADLPDELTQTTDTNPDREPCAFYTKTAACQYGVKCSRNHRRPGISTLLLLPNFFTHIRLEQGAPSEYGSDLLLEYDDDELYTAFTTFFHDVVPELETFGVVQQFRVCNNHKAHLRGNVYVQFTNQRDALKAYRNLQGRYYASRMLNVEFCQPISWRNAICGLAFANKCPKGHGCNFMHVFKNPANKFPLTDDRHVNGSLRRHRTPLIRRQLDSSWDDQGDEKSASRNWRWSESPEPTVDGASGGQKPSRMSENRSSRSSTVRRARSRSLSERPSKRRSRSKSHSKSRSRPNHARSKRKKYSSSRSRSRSRKNHRSQSKHRKHNR